MKGYLCREILVNYKYKPKEKYDLSIVYPIEIVEKDAQAINLNSLRIFMRKFRIEPYEKEIPEVEYISGRLVISEITDEIYCMKKIEN